MMVPVSPSPQSVGPSDSISRGSNPRRGRRWALVVGVATIVVVGSFALYYFETYPRLGPASFFVDNSTRVLPGSTGCSPTASELCYSLVMGTIIQSLRLSDLRFELTNETDEGPNGPRVPVGVNAGVTVIQPAGGEAGHWNWSAGEWNTGASWIIPTNANVSIVFDSGLSDASSLNETDFWIVVSGPGSAAVGDPLY